LSAALTSVEASNMINCRRGARHLGGKLGIDLSVAQARTTHLGLHLGDCPCERVSAAFWPQHAAHEPADGIAIPRVG
jgi:hypothetical protein